MGQRAQKLEQLAGPGNGLGDLAAGRGEEHVPVCIQLEK